MEYDYRPCKDGFILSVRATTDIEKQRCAENGEKTMKAAMIFILTGIFPDFDIAEEFIRQCAKGGGDK
jgi:hypothetical protein